VALVPKAADGAASWRHAGRGAAHLGEGRRRQVVGVAQHVQHLDGAHGERHRGRVRARLLEQALMTEDIEALYVDVESIPRGQPLEVLAHSLHQVLC
jgi:hypothetical protein